MKGADPGCRQCQGIAQCRVQPVQRHTALFLGDFEIERCWIEAVKLGRIFSNCRITARTDIGNDRGNIAGDIVIRSAAGFDQRGKSRFEIAIGGIEPNHRPCCP